MSDPSTLLGLTQSLEVMKHLKDIGIIDNAEFQELRYGILESMKAAISRMKERPIEDEMAKSIRERLNAQFKEDDKLYGKKPKMYRKDNELATSQRSTSKP